jgi:hypothetical protein
LESRVHPSNALFGLADGSLLAPALAPWAVDAQVSEMRMAPAVGANQAADTHLPALPVPNDAGATPLPQGVQSLDVSHHRQTGTLPGGSDSEYFPAITPPTHLTGGFQVSNPEEHLVDINLQWEYGGVGATRFHIYRTSPLVEFTVPASQYSFTDVGVYAGGGGITYHYRVTAVEGFNESAAAGPLDIHVTA